MKRALVSKILKSNFTRFVFEKFEVFCITVISCDPLPVYVHAHINSTMTSYDTRVLVTCDAGHLLADNSTHVVVTCGSDAEWSEVPHDCTGSRKQKTTNTQRIVQHVDFAEIICGPHPDVGNATRFNSTNLSLGATANFSCFDRHRFSDGFQEKTIACLAAAQWDDVEDACYSE